MARWRDVALIVALLAVAAAALLGPKPTASKPLASAGSTTPAGEPAASPSPIVGSLQLSASNVITSATPDGSTVLSVRLTAHLRAGTTLMLRTDATGPAITFRLVAPQSTAAVGTLRTTPPSILDGGAATALDLTFDLRGLSLVPPVGAFVAAGAPPAPGTWLLTVDLIDIGGARHHAETPVTVVPAA